MPPWARRPADEGVGATGIRTRRSPPGCESGAPRHFHGGDDDDTLVAIMRPAVILIRNWA